MNPSTTRVSSPSFHLKPSLRRTALQAASTALIAFASLTTYASQFVRLDHNLFVNARARGSVFFEIFDDRPLSQANFLQYVDGGHYDGTIMHRLSRNFVMQGGGYYPVVVTEPPPLFVSLDPTATVDLDGNPATPNPTVNNEAGNLPPRSNLRGTVSMVRTAVPNSATSQWFVNLVNNAFLDTSNGGFAVFGQVRGDGMTLYDAYNNGLSIGNFNPDADNNGVRELGPFGTNANDGVPFLNAAEDLFVVVTDAKRVDYLGTGSSTIVPSTGLTFSTLDTFIDTGAVLTGPGALTVATGVELGIREGTSLTQALINHGTVAPGLQLGSITVESFEQSLAGTLAIQLRGTAPDTQHDRLVVRGNAQLGGTLDVSLLGGFNPILGQHFTILTGPSITDSFNDFNLPTLTPGLGWDITQTTTALTLSVIAVPEPATLSLFAVALGLTSATRRRR